jgi:hypothetical protein
MQIDRRLVPFRFTLRQYSFLKKMLLNTLGQIAPNPDDRFSERAKDLFLGLGSQFSHREPRYPPCGVRTKDPVRYMAWSPRPLSLYLAIHPLGPMCPGLLQER